MFIQPVYNILLLPDVTYYFKKDYFAERADELKPDTDLLFVLLKNETEGDRLQAEDFYSVGLSARVESISEEDVIQIRTTDRVEVLSPAIEDGAVRAAFAVRPSVNDLSAGEQQQIFSKVRADLLRFVQGYQWGLWARGFILQRKNIYDLVSSLSEYLNLSVQEKYDILAEDSVKARYSLIEKAVNEFMEVAKVSVEAQAAQKDGQEQLYREAALKKQINYLQKELDDMHPENISDVRKFEKKISESGMNKEARREAEKVLNRMRQEGKESHEYGLLYDYLDFVTSLSWKAPALTPIDLQRAEKILDEDHYGLKKVKQRIIQQLAVMALNQKQYGSILLFVGAPGTGKTSIGQSIARALGREYIRISLGGIRDEAEIRGHRRTYIGAMPGRIMEAMKRSGSSNPVMVLDEVDKLAKDYGGDPASALLEVLDPEQNSTFTDHYMNVPYDLSNVLFVCTANSTDTIPEPLLNRMEVISFPGYTAVEKFHIAKKHLIPKAMDTMGIKKKMLKITDGALREIIDEYTMESGVRDLKKSIETLCRTAAVELVKNSSRQNDSADGTAADITISVTKGNLTEYLGRKQLRSEQKLSSRIPGVVTGLAWTRAGGAILFIETKLTKGKGQLLITGQLGDVMKESVQIALTLVRSLYPKESRILEDHDLHIHVPAGAVPKDGPSAGITLTTALASLITGKAVDTDCAMTGEVSLRGGVMPIGGLPEKLMAAQRAGIKKVYIPIDNTEDLEDVADEVKDKLKIIPVKKVSDVLKDQALM
ncbi:MAG TPA: endopeptidase La [Candidatus Mediterraneibacter stercorigallinarum]|uniref:endopeptidase La n=1 Tax=Candidatus Mediterraneibacter stercorigallinarum TaxID=2838686 RepID=A0A9D2D908_9FIRM|nr:endopeptidase La [Candidatus Mediterraneibacter stercorigallinarum]